MTKFLKKFAFMLLMGIIGFASCANGSGSGSDSPEVLLDKAGESYSDGLYSYNDGTTSMYLYYEYQNLVRAGNAENEYTGRQLQILKQSHSWQSVHQYCSKVSDVYQCEWYYKETLAEKEFKKGWYKFFDRYGTQCYGYFESCDSSMTYTTVLLHTDDQYYRVRPTDTKFSVIGSYNYSSETWKKVYLADSDHRMEFQSDDLDYYPEPTPERIFKKGWYEFHYYPDGYNVKRYQGYFEAYDSAMTYTTIYINGNGQNIFRTNVFEGKDHYSSSTWDELLSSCSDYLYGGDDLENYPELNPSE